MEECSKLFLERPLLIKAAATALAVVAIGGNVACSWAAVNDIDKSRHLDKIYMALQREHKPAPQHLFDKSNELALAATGIIAVDVLWAFPSVGLAGAAINELSNGKWGNWA